jgi:O-antigen/teichoic acid export membrane protein
MARMLRALHERVIRILRRSEKYTKTDMVYLARGSTLSFIGQGASIAASLILAVAVSHFVSKEAYGEYKYILSIVGLLSVFSLNGIPSAVFQSAAQGYDGALIRGFWENIRWSALVFVITFVLAAYYFIMGSAALATEILIGGSLSPFLGSANLFASFLGGKKDFYRQTVYGIIDNVIPIFIFIGVVLVTGNPVILVATYFATNLLAGLYFYRRTIAVYRASLHLHDGHLLSYSKHLSVMGFIGGIAGGIDQILLFHYVGAAQLAVYTFVTAIPDLMRGPAKNLSSMMQAQFAVRTNKEIHSGMVNKVMWILVLAAGVTIAYVSIAPFIFATLFPNYRDAISYSQIYALVLLAMPLDAYATYLTSKKRTKELYMVYFFYSIVQIVSMFAGIIFWGLFGLILSRVATRFATGFVAYLMYRNAIVRETPTAHLKTIV